MTSKTPHTRQIRFEHAGNTLAGTLLLPDGEPPRAALGMLQGSGPTDRDNFGYFPAIREMILNAGVAVLAWDKPGIGESSGDWRRHTLGDRAAEALAGIEFVRRQPELGEARVGLFGHSQGGWVAPIAAAVAPDEVDFIVTQSGPGISIREQSIYDVEHSMRRDGQPEAAIQRGKEYVQALLDAADRGDVYQVVDSAILEHTRDEPCWDYFAVPDAAMWGYFRRSWREDPHPGDVLSQVRCPILAIFGELDHLLPVSESVRVYRDSLSTAGNAAVTIKVFTGVGHRLTDPESGEFAPGYSEMLVRWLQEQTRHGPT